MSAVWETIQRLISEMCYLRGEGVGLNLELAIEFIEKAVKLVALKATTYLKQCEVCVVLLHDVVEDSDMTLDDLRAQGFSEKIIDALALLTHDGKVPYMDYVKSIKDSGNQTAVAVKLADLRHNSDETRLDGIDDAAKKRLHKYKEAIDLLTGSSETGRDELKREQQKA